MLEEPRNEGALADWEGEGGSVSAASLDPTERERARCLPWLPSGYEAQPAWGSVIERGASRTNS